MIVKGFMWCALLLHNSDGDSSSKFAKPVIAIHTGLLPLIIYLTSM